MAGYNSTILAYGQVRRIDLMANSFCIDIIPQGLKTYNALCLSHVCIAYLLDDSSYQTGSGKTFTMFGPQGLEYYQFTSTSAVLAMEALWSISAPVSSPPQLSRLRRGYPRSCYHAQRFTCSSRGYPQGRGRYIYRAQKATCGAGWQVISNQHLLLFRADIQ